MGLFEHFPYVNFHQLNIDWVLEKVKYCLATVETFASRLLGCENRLNALEPRMDAAETEIERNDQNIQAAARNIAANAINIVNLQRVAPAPTEDDLRKVLTATAEGVGSWEDAPEELPPHSAAAPGSALTVGYQGGALVWREIIPPYTGTDAEKILAVNQGGDALEWRNETVELPPYTGADWDSSLRIIDIGGGVYRPAWHAPAVVSFATGNISAANLTSPTVTALRTGNTVQIDLEGEVTATDDVVITVSKYRPIGSAGSALPWQIPAIVNEITHATTTYEIDNSGDLIITVFNLTAADAFGLHLVYITDEPIEQPA